MAPKININIDAIMKLPLNKRVAILAGVNVVLILLIGWFLTYPSYSEVSGYRKQLDELNAKLTKDRRIAADIPRYLREKKEMEDALVRALTQLPNEQEIPDLFDSLAKSAMRSGLKIESFKPGNEAPKGFYAEVPVSLVVTTKFAGLYDFSKKVAEMDRIVNLEKMEISSTGHVKREPQLKVSMSATTFRFIAQPPAPAKPAPDKPTADKPAADVKKP
ncbi:MAG: type 4a pilus biogenesis protein PilO [Deltaproteobacteria bacterium]|nr:type 4a pilus biogenesis protein PilO [Deltaproteobacteria bacterium]